MTGHPASTAFRIARIWCSLNLLLRIEASWCHSRSEPLVFDVRVLREEVTHKTRTEKVSLFNVKKRRRRFLKAGASIYGRWISELLFVGFLPRRYVC